MVSLAVKEIKGNKYLYLKDKLKDNSKSVHVEVYCGRLDKLTADDVSEKYRKLTDLRLTTYLDTRMEKYSLNHLALPDITPLETMRYYYHEFRHHFPDESSKYIDSVYVRYIQGTTAIEGNTLTPGESQELLEHGIVPAGKQIREVYEILNFVKLRRYLSDHKGIISERLVKEIHAIIMERLVQSPGEYRRIEVFIANADYTPPPALLVPAEMKNLIGWYKKHAKIMHPFELAVELHTRFEMIHPFPDGNGRVGRALMNLVLEQAGYPTLYLGLADRKAYLDAMIIADDGDFGAITQTLHDIYLQQHDTVIHSVRKILTNQKPDPKVLRDFKKLKK